MYRTIADIKARWMAGELLTVEERNRLNFDLRVDDPALIFAPASSRRILADVNGLNRLQLEGGEPVGGETDTEARRRLETFLSVRNGPGFPYVQAWLARIRAAEPEDPAPAASLEQFPSRLLDARYSAGVVTPAPVLPAEVVYREPEPDPAPPLVIALPAPPPVMWFPVADEDLAPPRVQLDPVRPTPPATVLPTAQLRAGVVAVGLAIAAGLLLLAVRPSRRKKGGRRAAQ